ncbi:MAG: DUF1853 family protein [Akkermansiaceae bacterium]|nr:DUF1853 family protein [Akkermansiaceae bacterium]
MIHSSDIVSKALFQSLIEGPLLLDDLPEATAFPSDSLVAPKEATPLNLEQKLGYLYEDALAVMLESTPRYDPLERGIQIRREAGHTLGELDFLVRDLTSGRLIHLELAVKFYLAVETDSGLLLPGPDARDNYFRKLEKLRSHQLVLVDKFRDLLPEKFREEEIVSQQLVQGCIFNHVNASRPVEEEFLNPKGRRGKWLHAEECADYFGENALLEIVPKPLWPVPLEIMEGVQLEKWKVDDGMDRCVMVRSDVENLAYFIAPNGYPLNTHDSRAQ